MFDLHTSPHEYVEALAGYRPGKGAVPVIARDPAVVERIAALHNPGTTHRPVPDTSGTVVAYRAGSPLAPVARALAGVVDGVHRELADAGDVADILAEFPGTPYLLLLGLGNELSERDVLSVHDQLWAAVATGFRGSMGLVSAEHLEDVSWMIAKGLAFPHRRLPVHADVRVWSALDAAEAPTRGRLLLGKDTSADTLIPLLRDGHQGLMSAFAHGRDDVLHMHDTVVCARHPEKITDPGADLSRHPVCAFTGECFRYGVSAEQILRADQMQVDAVFANSCMSWRVGDGLFPYDYLLPTGFLRGAAAGYVGIPQLLRGVAKLNEFFHAASEAGASLGEATALVNDHLRYEQTEPPYFTLLGLPWVTLEPTGTRRSEPSGISVLAGGDTMAGDAAAAAGTLRAGEQAGRAVHVLQVSPRSAGRLFPHESLLQEETAADGHELEWLGIAVDSLADIPYLGFRYARHSEAVADLRDRVTSLATALHDGVSVGDLDGVRLGTEALRHSVDQAERTLATLLHERGTTSFLNFDDLWGEILERRPGQARDGGCPHCGRRLIRFTAVHPLLGRVQRETAECGRCSVISDLSPGSPLAGMEVRGVVTWYRGHKVAAELVLRPAPELDRPLRIWVGAHTENSVDTGLSFPGPRQILLAPGSDTVVPVEAEIGADAQTHQQYLRGFAVARGSVTWASKPVWVRPS
jgi:hypothetical protein